MHEVGDELLILFTNVGHQVREHTLSQHFQREADGLVDEPEMLALLVGQV
jgi:hypothetical protein